MVDVEEALEQIGVLDLVLQLVEQLDLAVHQRLEPHGRD